MVVPVDIDFMEEILCLHQSKEVVIVRPFFGTQNDSIVGDLLWYDTTTKPLKFHVSAIGMAIIFTMNDVKSVEERDKLIITLKGPSDYPAA